MPLTDYQKNWALQKAGKDPASYDLTDDGYIVPKTTNQQPTLSHDSIVDNKPSPIPSASNSYSPVQTAAMSFGQAAPSAIGGGLGAAGGLAAASWLAGPEVGIPVSLLAMLGGGIAGSATAKGIQGAVEPNSWNQAVQEAAAQNPKSAIAGDLASIPLGGFSPSPSGALRGIGAGAKVLTGMEATAPEMLALKNLAFNAGLGAAQPSINYALGQGPAPTVSSTLQGAGIGALFNKPNVIGNALGFSVPEMPQSGISKEQLLAALQSQQQPSNLPQVEPTPDINSLVSAYGAPGTRGDIISGSLQNVAGRTDKMAGYRATPEQVDIGTFEGEGGKPAPAEDTTQEIRQAKETAQRVKDFQLAKQELANSELDRSVAEMKAAIENNRLQAESAGKNVQPLVTTETGKDIMPDYTGVTEQNNTEAANESPNDLALRKLEGFNDKYQQESAFPTKTVEPTHLSVKEAIDNLQARTDDASILPEDANELHKILSMQVDWSKMPEVGKLIQERNFDPLDPDNWVKVQDEYNKYTNAPKIQQAPKADIVTPTATGQTEAPVTTIKNNAPRGKIKEPLPQGTVADVSNTNPGTLDYVKNYLKTRWETVNRERNEALAKKDYKTYDAKTKELMEVQKLAATKYQNESELKNQIKDKLTAEGIPTSNVKQWNAVISKWAEPRFGIEISDDGNITNSSTGRPVAGQAFLRNALREAFIKINPDKAGIDTLPHELHHVFMDYLERFGSASDKKFISRAYDKVSKEPEFQKAKAENPSLDPNEFLASRGGLEFIRRQLNLEGHSDWKQFYKDFVAHLKDKFTKSASLEDYSRLLNYKMIHDPVDGNSPFNGIAPSTKNQDDSKIFQGLRGRDIENLRLGKSLVQDKIDQGFTRQESVENVVKNLKNLGIPEEKIRAYIDPKPMVKDGYYATVQHDNEVPGSGYVQLDEVRNGENVRSFSPEQAAKEGLQLPDRNSLKALEQGKHFLGDLKNQDYSQFAPTKSLLDKAETKADQQGAKKEGEEFSKAIQKFYPLKEQLQGKYMEPIRKASEGIKQADINKVEDTLLEEFRTKQDLSSQLSGKQLDLYKAIRDSYNTKQQDQIAANQPVTDYKANGTPFKRLPQVDPYYHVNRINPKIAEKLISGTAAEKAALKQEFMNWQQQNGISTQAATEKLNGILDAYKANKPDMSSFAANRKAEGVGLPDSWLRKGDLLRTLNNYYGRVSTDRAWHDTIETNPDVAKSLGMTKDPWGKPINSQAQDISHIPEVTDVTNKITGELVHKHERVVKGLNRIASALMLGPLTNVHIAAGSAANSINYIHPGELVPAFSKAVKDLADNWQKVYETGYHTKDYSSIRDLTDANMTALEKMNSLSSSISNLSGRQGMNHFTKSFLQGVGEYIVKNRALQANNGDAAAIRLMKQVDPDWQQGKVYTGKDLDNVASTFASYIHGAHDVRTLPGWMLKDTAIQPFFSLASWNIAQTNAWMKHVWTPAKEGNFTPLIMSTLGSVLGGYVVKNLREEIADKKSPIPSLTELANSDKGLEGNIPLVAYNLMAMSSYTGFAGILSTAAKAGQDIAFKNIPQGAAFPLDELISNPATRVSQFMSAMMNDPAFDYVNAGSKLSLDLVRENFQLGRILENWTADKTDILGENAHYEKNVNDALGDLRRFKMAEGLPYEAQEVSDANPYMDRTLKEFKRTQDMGKAMEDFPTLVQAAFTKADGNIEVLRQQLGKIKQNNYETMPSPQNIPRTFLTYLNYLKETQGEKVASDRLSNYLMQEGFNKMKSSMVPTF